MNVNRVSALTNNQAAYGQSNSQSSQDAGDSTGGWKYLTVRKGGRVYTYIVIGKNMQILIGETVDKEKDETQDKKAAGCKAAGDAEQTKRADNKDEADKPATEGQQDKSKKEIVKADFLTDTSMLALTGYYQKKIRQTIKEMQENLGDDKHVESQASVASKRQTTCL